MFILKVVILLLTCVSWSSCKQISYCFICRDHTLCKYDGLGEGCKNPGLGGVSEEEKKEIVDTHNSFRRTVANGLEKRGISGPQLKAADMRKMVWDDELAKVAQGWADQCTFGHDTCRDDKRWKVGQNLYWKMKYPKHEVNWTEAITSWYDEVTLYDSKEVNDYKFNPNSGHFTQMIWHDTSNIGCGRRDYGYNKIYVCNYGPSGNWIGEPIYTVGEPCSKCPQGTHCEEHLCETDYHTENMNELKAQPIKKSSAENNQQKNPELIDAKVCEGQIKEAKNKAKSSKKNLLNGLKKGLKNITVDLEQMLLSTIDNMF